MKILQFGQTGQVSRAMIAEATAGTVTLVALSRQDVDLTDTAAIRQIIAEADCDLVVNCAGFTLVDRAEAEPEAAMAANAAAPAAMALACSRRDLPLVHLSTDCVFDGRLDRPYRETDDPRPLSVYGRSKLEGETAVLAWEKGVVLRISWVFSRFGRNFIRTMLELGRARDVLNIVADQYGNPTDATALAQFILTTAPRWASAPAGDPGFGCFHFTNQGSTSRHALAEAALARDPQTRARVLPILKRDYPEPAARPLNGRLDCTRLTDVFGWTPSPWRPAVEQATDWILAEGLDS
ncbi:MULTISPECIES: dTDP-4-dehydrorhamnose reductase [unclassified Caulobacter]|uniref:dTDP-4-dehydrorhamnose reductase n=1 Tax=unclassified Caulobacter TaxID=2648921 RepID=UPI000D3ABFDC|nr:MULTISPECIES: dTDP-4-dehydrorhamnose reductase [unclassified Caulobacter]PTS87729.1 dTDP-4-dehydrorhamnose reductase [Caulobacter sp. HMWF009]PTT12522.1 dTDP-4-dehydrorhamnose reductase [Caulobacter sp. HMWF025]